MKKLLLFLFTMMLSVAALFAQAPQKMSYQVVVRNTSNALVTNQNVSAKISILQGSVNGTPVYVETHTATTNVNGLLTLEVGDGTTVTGSLEAVNWAEGPFFLKSEIDPDGGINYSIEGTQQLLSVPYALYAEKAGNVPAFAIVPADSGYVINITQPGQQPQTFFLPTGGGQGPAGEDGLSAYQLWLNAGNTGTEADFLASLVGAPGNDGNDGIDGKGILSIVKTGTEENVDTYTITYTDSTSSTFTVTNGVDGTNGTDGNDGVSPTITVSQGDAGTVLIITDVNGSQQVTIPSSTGGSEGGTLVQQQVNWSDTNITSVTYILNKPTKLSQFENDLNFVSATDIPAQQQADWNETDTSSVVYIKNKPEIPTVPTNVSELSNDAGYITMDSIPAIPIVPTNVSEFTNDAGYITMDSIPEMPEVPTKLSDLENDMGFITTIPDSIGGISIEYDPIFTAWNKDYNDLINTPDIPTVPTNVSEFTNDAGYITMDSIPTIPTNVSELTNDAGYITMDSIPAIPTVPTNVSEFTNDAGYITMDSIPAIPTVPTNVSEFTNDAGYITMDSIPGIPDPQVNADWNATSGVAEILNKPDIAGMQNTMDSLADEIDNLHNSMGFICGKDKVKDIDGNEYNTVKIGQQCWMKENLRTTKYPDGTDIPIGTDSSSTLGTRNVPGSESNVADRGYLYNWAAVMNGSPSSSTNPSNVQGICPDGWHVPSNKEFTQLIEYVRSIDDNVCSADPNSIAKALASSLYWSSSSTECSIGKDLSANNATGFSAVPTGYWLKYDSNGWYHTNLNYSTNYWTSEDYLNPAWAYCLNIGNTSLSPIQAGWNYRKTNAYSVRCLQDPQYTPVQDMIDNSILPLQNTIDSLHNALNESFENLQESTGFICGVNTVKDYDENVYATVKIGEQCWLRENLKTTHYSDGTEIPLGTDTSASLGYRYYPSKSAEYVSEYGYLYNWHAVIHSSSSSNANPSGVQGVCPTGWHVPSATEWEQLKNYMQSQNQYHCNETSGNIAKALADKTGWKLLAPSSSYTSCAIGVNISDNNSSGFSARAAGWLSDDANNYSTIEAQCIFGSSYSFSGVSNYVYGFTCGDSVLRTWINPNHRAHSIRCLRDPETSSSSSLTSENVQNMIDSSLAPLQNQINQQQNTIDSLQNLDIQNLINNVIAPLQNLINQQQNTIDSLQNILQNLTEELEENSTISFKCGTSIVKDHEGNRYHTVRIGEQCWLKENLRTTTSPSTGAYLVNPLGLSGNQYTNSYTGKVAHWYLNDSLTYAPKNYGLLYNWCAAMDTFKTGFSEVASVEENNTDNRWYISPAATEMRRGICPAGWHLPTSEEWTTMEIAVSDSVGNLNETSANIYRGSHAGRLAGGNDWQTSTNEQSPGNYNYSERNVSGFESLPAGCTRYDATLNAFFWTASQRNWVDSHYRRMIYSNKGVNTNDYYGSGEKRIGMSVRCLKD